VELDPSSAAYKARLQRVNEHTVPGVGHAGNARLLGKPVWVWIAALGLVAVALSIVLISINRGPKRLPATARPRTAAHTMQPPAPKTHGSPMAGAPLAGKPEGSSLVGGQVAGSAGLRTPAESAIRAAVAEAQSAAPGGARVDDVIADPRQGVATVTFSVPGGPALTRGRIAAVAVGVARAAFAANAEVKFVTARCLITTGAAAGNQIAFVGDIARQSVEALGRNPTAERLAAAFANQWWNPQLGGK
jgi:hypothetical protein